MGRKYNQLSLKERIDLYRLRSGGMSFRKIGELLGRSASTICREYKRNSKVTKQWSSGYEPARANYLAKRRREWDCRFKLERQPHLRKIVRNYLVMGLSPEQISGRLTHLHHRIIISHESIYRYIYHRSAQKDYWHKLLPRRRSRRGRYSRKTNFKLYHLKERVSIHDKPSSYRDRKRNGHWEADLMSFRQSKQHLLICCDRKSRFIFAVRQNKQASSTYQNLVDCLHPLPHSHRQTIVFDNGTEFAHHHHLKESLNMKTYFCDLKSPWQKGSVENAIGRLRRFLPRKTDIHLLSHSQIQYFISKYNNTPRKCLDFKTPLEIFSQSIPNSLHFIRESIFLPPQE